MPFNNSGLRALGVNAINPPDAIFMKWDPTPNDYIMHDVGKLWYVDYGTTPATYSLWYLASKANMVATWIRLYPQGGGGGGNLRSDDNREETPNPVTLDINVLGGSPYIIGSDIRLGDPNYVNMYTVQFPDTHTLEIVLKRSINQPPTNITATEGMYKLGGIDFMFAYGTDNTMLGLGCANLGITIAQAVQNTCIGASALDNLTTGDHNTALGSRSLNVTESGQYVIGIGANAGSALDPADSSDILIGNAGKNTESNAIHIGAMPFPNPLAPVGVGEQDKAYMAGIWNCGAIPTINTGLVIVDDKGQLYVDDIANNSIIVTDAGGNPVGLKGAPGTVLTGLGLAGADPSPAFLPITSPDLSVGVGIDPITGGITLVAAPAGGGVSQFTTDDTLVVFPDIAHNINVLGDTLVATSGAVASTIQLTFAQGLDGQVLGGNTGLPSTYKTLNSTDGSISIINHAGSLDLTVVGVPPVGGINMLTAHTGGAVPPTAFNINIEQGDSH